MPKEMLTLYTKLFVDRGNGDENLIDLLTTPDLGIGDPEKVEVTNLQDGTRRYINGLKDVGDSLEFEFNYTTDGYEKLKEIEESKEIYIYKVVLPDELCFEFEAALSVKITGAAVGEQIKMTINLTPYSTIKVGQYGENNGTAQVNEYSTFTFRGSESASESVTYNTRNTGMIVMMNNVPNSIEELYVNDVPQQIPQISAEEMLEGGGGGDDAASLLSILQVNEGDIIKVKGGFSLAGNGFENIINISDIKLQSDLEDCSYMFFYCTSLTEAPEIPNSVTNCENMFGHCSDLLTVPVIPNSVTNCSYMFYDCTSLTEAPEIPEGVTNCEGMFEYCSDLLTAPVIPNSVTNCSYMFDGCAGLTEAPVIPNSVTNCEGMFYECTSLIEAPVIPSSVTDCSYMFEGCTNLSVIPQENIDLMNNPPEGLNFENCYAGCPLVADQIPVAWGGNKVEEPKETTYTVTYLGQTKFGEEQYTYSNKATTVNAGDSFTTTLTAINNSGGYAVVSIIKEMEVWMGGIEITEECGVVSGVEVTITIKNVTGDIIIDVTDIGVGTM